MQETGLELTLKRYRFQVTEICRKHWTKKGIELVNTPDLFDSIWESRPQISWIKFLNWKPFLPDFHVRKSKINNPLN
jgi:hypothetical protein